MRIRTLGCACMLAMVGQFAQAATTLPVLLPDGRPYTDADVSARDLPEAPNFSRSQPAATVAPLTPPLSPVHQLTNEGWLAASTQRAGAAQLNFGRALRIQPNNRRLLWAYGWGMLNLDDPACAMEAFQRNLSLRPAQRPLWVPMAMALTYTASGQREAALAWYRAAVQSDPLRYGSHDATLRATQYWTPRERALVRQLMTYAASGGGSPHGIAAP